VNWSTLNRWLAALKLPTFKTLVHPKVANYPLNRGECVDFLHRVLMQRGEDLPTSYDTDPNDAMPFDDDDNKVLDRLQPK
jgi:hypothetical protein